METTKDQCQSITEIKNQLRELNRNEKMEPWNFEDELQERERERERNTGERSPTK